jgi:glycosyltransferase involved in cell wall biosynthesis
MSIKGLNHNAISFIRWLFVSNDEFKSVVFLFVSKRNANNARYLPLFNETQNIRIVFMTGLRIKYTDVFVMKLFITLIKFFKFKISIYESIHIFDLNISFKTRRQILHIDDPSYTLEELSKIRDWESRLRKESKLSNIVCTNNYSKFWLESNSVLSKIYVVEQGFHSVILKDKIEADKFLCVYSSPYIYFGKDKYAKHTTFGANLLIGSLIPELLKIDPDIEVHLIGQLGKHAKKFLRPYTNVKMHGRVSFEKNIEILSKCSVGIYPRTFDHKRSMLKIFSYIGAGLPIVTFDLIDTAVVKENKLGCSVTQLDEFIECLVNLKNSRDLLHEFKKNVSEFRVSYDWKSLATKMEILLGSN